MAFSCRGRERLCKLFGNVRHGLRRRERRHETVRPQEYDRLRLASEPVLEPSGRIADRDDTVAARVAVRELRRRLDADELRAEALPYVARLAGKPMCRVRSPRDDRE